MNFISMVISFLVYPFYSLVKSIKDIFRIPKPFISFNIMDDYFYVVSYFLEFSKILPSSMGVLGGIAAYLIMKKYLPNLPDSYKIVISVSLFTIIFWIVSIISYLIQSLIYVSNVIKRVSTKVGEISSKKFTDEDSTKIVH